MSTDPKTRAWMEIRADALRWNLGRIRASVGPRVRLVPMVKADGYGLGVERVVEVLEAEDCWGFGVAAVDEGVALRAMGVQRPVLVLSPLPPGAAEAAVEDGLVVGVSHAHTFQRLEQAAVRVGRPATFHLEVDTGIGRAGFDWRCVGDWAPGAHAAHAAGVRWEGCYTHLHSADEDETTVVEQWARFQEAVREADPPEGGGLLHVLNSAGALRCPRYAAHAVRPGIFLYGGRAAPDLPAPKTVASVRARLVHVRSAPAGTTAGYGSTYRSSGDEVWATAAIGYGDGLPRALGNRGTALVRGRRVPIIGRISMDVTVVDISGVPGVEPGDVATFLGSDGDDEITADEMAKLVDTISYEILTGFTPRIPRVWLEAEHGS
jgi:alanine racemase